METPRKIYSIYGQGVITDRQEGNWSKFGPSCSQNKPKKKNIKKCVKRLVFPMTPLFRSMALFVVFDD